MSVGQGQSLSSPRGGPGAAGAGTLAGQVPRPGLALLAGPAGGSGGWVGAGPGGHRCEGERGVAGGRALGEEKGSVAKLPRGWLVLRPGSGPLAWAGTEALSLEELICSAGRSYR